MFILAGFFLEGMGYVYLRVRPAATVAIDYVCWNVLTNIYVLYSFMLFS